MKTRLDQLTTAEFVDLVCGDKSVLLGKYEIPNSYNLNISMRNIIMEYRGIADPGGTASYLQRTYALIKARIAIALYTIADSLVALQEYEEARMILIAAGLTAEGWSDKRIESEIHVQLKKHNRAFDELDKEEDNEEKENIRNAFNSMIAAMMAHFKFQIDAHTMMAPVFAHLVAQYHAEIKAMKIAMKRH